jgi:hypothetical protein
MHVTNDIPLGWPLLLPLPSYIINPSLTVAIIYHKSFSDRCHHKSFRNAEGTECNAGKTEENGFCFDTTITSETTRLNSAFVPLTVDHTNDSRGDLTCTAVSSIDTFDLTAASTTASVNGATVVVDIGALDEFQLKSQILTAASDGSSFLAFSTAMVQDMDGTVRVFRQKFTLEDAIGSHACSLEASSRVTNGIPLGSSLFLPVHTVNCVQTLKVSMSWRMIWPRPCLHLASSIAALQ